MRAKNHAKKQGRSPKIPEQRPPLQTTPIQVPHILTPQPDPEREVRQNLSLSMVEEAAPDDELLAYSLDAGQLSTFSVVLRQILGHDRAEIVRVAKELEVAENTVYRWINGRSEPRPMHLRGLIDVLPNDRSNLAFAINKTFPEVLTTPIIKYEMSGEVTRAVMEMVTTIASRTTPLRAAQQYIFDAAFLLFGAQQTGLCITYAKPMPAQADNEIHTLREEMVQGSFPWPLRYPCNGYYGSTTLVGHVTDSRKTSTWDDVVEEERLLVEIDDFELSACAHPLMRRGEFGGVFMISSNDPDLFHDLYARQTVGDLARLFSLTLSDNEFVSPKMVKLRPLPGLALQRRKLIAEYANRITQIARHSSLDRVAAENLVVRTIEREFEEIGECEAKKQRQLSKRIPGE